jgi:hypothetical protein
MTVCWFPISLTAVTDVYVYMYIYKSEYKCLCLKEINVKDFPVPPPFAHYEYQFSFHDMCIFHIVKYRVRQKERTDLGS